MSEDNSVEVEMTEVHSVYGVEREVGDKVLVHPSIAERLTVKKVAKLVSSGKKSIKIGGKQADDQEALDQGPEATE